MGRPPGNAHGEIVAIDTAAALAAPGVVTVWTSRDTADHPPIGLRGHRHTAGQCLPADALPAAGAGASEMRYVGEPVDALSFLINAAEKTHWILCLNGFGVFKPGRCSGLGPEVSSPSGHNPATVAGAKGVPVDDSGGR